ncbi:alpha/beta hydrolase [Sphingomonas daechungensis]|uniref:Alpha/beta hydrolase n=1 Tax=Sphingomonas daechungensis TaxID=1176646 RepID=A0ABX6T0S6_9SPHN|nr:alpha/beta hydrolase [Sphingomonas daechungensis]QNP43164.1 alpha/beta hydrolase [Sphingomonas daechungensis]
MPGPRVHRGTTYQWAGMAGLRIFYREAGPRDAPTLVLLHGYPSSSRMYEPLLRRLSERFRLVAPDYPGFGHSDAPPPSDFAYTFDHLAETMSALLHGLGIDRYVLLMQDYGGPVGFRMALRDPRKVLGIIVQNANAYREGLGPKWKNIGRFWEDPVEHREEFERFASLESARQRHLGNSPNPERYDPDLWVDEFAFLSRPGQSDIQAALLGDYRTNVEAYPAWQAWLRTHLPPTLVLWGRYDPSFIVPGALAYCRDVPDAELHLLDAGHFALDEAPDEVAGLISNFVERRIANAA